VPAVPGTIRHLPAIGIEGHAPSNPGGADHPMRIMTRRAAGLEGPGWDADARAEVAGLFDRLAPEWHTRVSPQREAVVVDALDRGLPAVAGRSEGRRPGTAVEVGSGIGTYSALLAERFERVVAVDLSAEMLRLAAGEPAVRVLADSAALPLADGAADALVLVNMLLFPDEVDRVLAADGCVVWANSSGESTPIHLPPEDVIAALPGAWTGIASRAGVGLWAVVRRA
jgi:SAM-dependent methyltransferase